MGPGKLRSEEDTRLGWWAKLICQAKAYDRVCSFLQILFCWFVVLGLKACATIPSSIVFLVSIVPLKWSHSLQGPSLTRLGSEIRYIQGCGTPCHTFRWSTGMLTFAQTSLNCLSGGPSPTTASYQVTSSAQRLVFVHGVCINARPRTSNLKTFLLETINVWSTLNIINYLKISTIVQWIPWTHNRAQHQYSTMFIWAPKPTHFKYIPSASSPPHSW